MIRHSCPPDLWPVRASLLCEPVPIFPTDEDFQRAAMAATNHFPEPAHVWRMEAIRWRRNPANRGQPMDLPAIQVQAEAAMVRLAVRAAGGAA